MRLAVCVLLVGCAAVVAATARASVHSAPVPVSCDDIVDRLSEPPRDGYRLVLGVLAVPPAFSAQGAVHVGGRWPYWLKSGIAVRAGAFGVDVRVPEEWRSRAAITWGNSHRVAYRLRLDGCGRTPLVGAWNAYAGGVLLRTPSACVPLVFTLGRRSATVRFGIGRRCR